MAVGQRVGGGTYPAAMTATQCPIHDEPMIGVVTPAGTVWVCEWCQTGHDPKTFVAPIDYDDEL